MTFEWWFAYLLTSLILSLSPGSGAINTMTTSINHGYRGAAASIAGLQTGLAIHIVLVGIGLGTLFSRSVLAFEVLKWAGAAYLIWLGIQQWRAAGAIDLNTLVSQQPRRQLFQRAVFVNLTNPKSIVFLAALFPQFIDARLPQMPQLVILTCTFCFVECLWQFIYAGSGRHIGRTGLHRRAGLVLGHVVKFLSGGHGLHRRQPAVPQDRHCQLPAVDPLLRQDLGAVAQHLLQGPLQLRPVLR